MPAGNSTARPYNRKEKKAIKDKKSISEAYRKVSGSKTLTPSAKARMKKEVLNSKKSKSSNKTLANRQVKAADRRGSQKAGSTRRVHGKK